MFGSLFKKKKGLVGLDIGSYAIKLVELEEAKAGYRLKALGIVNVSPEFMDEGGLKDPGAIAEAIKNLMASYKITEKNVSTSISGFSVIIKKIDLPVMEEAELEENILVEAEQFIPYNVEDVNIAFQILTSPEEKSTHERMDVILVAAKKDIVEDYIAMLKSAGLGLMVMDVDFFALQNAFELNYEAPEEEGCIALVDIGASKMNINVVKNGIPMFTRDASIGGLQITKDIQEKFKLSYEDAEKVKLGNLGDIDPKELEDIFIAATNGWSTEVKRAIDFFYATYQEEVIHKMLISGGSARLPGLDKLLSKDTGLPVEILDPLKKVEIDSKTFDPDYIRYVAPQLTIAVGLALRTMEE